MLTIYNLIGTSLCVVSNWIIRVYTILVWNTISGSSNLDICCYHCLILTIIFHLKVLINFFFFLIFIIIIINSIIGIIIITTTTTTITIISITTTTTSIIIIVVVIVVTIVVVTYNLYNQPPCGSTPVLPGYLLLRHSCTWEKTSIFWSCQVFGAVAGEVNSCTNYSIYFIFSFYFSCI